MPSGSGNMHRMRVAERQLDVLALHLRAVADPDDVELALEAVLHARHHVGDQRAGQAVQRPDPCGRSSWRVDEERAVGDARRQCPPGPAGSSLPLGPSARTVSAVHLDLHARREWEWVACRCGTCGLLLPHVGEDFPADLLLAGLAIGEHAARRRQQRHAHARPGSTGSCRGST